LFVLSKKKLEHYFKKEHRQFPSHPIKINNFL
jgi:hypothetical protein